MTRTSRDVVIAGGGIIGSSIAFWLANDPDFDGSVTVIERDPTYADSSTSRSVGAFRQQFSTRENVEIGLFALRFFRRAHDVLRVGDEALDFSLQEPGYLFLAGPTGRRVLQRNHTLQRECGVNVSLLDPPGIAEQFPWMQVGDLAAGSLGAEEGWLDPHALMLAFRAKAAALGAEFVNDEVVSVRIGGPADRGANAAGRVEAVGLVSGAELGVGSLVNAAGPRAAELARMAGIGDLPVHPRKRIVYTVDCAERIDNCPLVIDTTGVWFRPEAGGRFLCGVSPPADRDPDCLDLDIDFALFDEIVWPALANRVPAFDALKRGNSWAGHYAVNVLDHNAVIGPHPAIDNFLFANGFSGHGVQQSPAVGRAVAELVTHGGYRTLDLSRFAFDRFASGELIREVNVI